MTEVLSPCQQICRIDPRTELCVGCRRSLYEIAAWSRLADDERRSIMAALPTRTSAPPMPKPVRRGGRAGRVGDA